MSSVFGHAVVVEHHLGSHRVAHLKIACRPIGESVGFKPRWYAQFEEEIIPNHVVEWYVTAGRRGVVQCQGYNVELCVL